MEVLVVPPAQKTTTKERRASMASLAQKQSEIGISMAVRRMFGDYNATAVAVENQNNTPGAADIQKLNIFSTTAHITKTVYVHPTLNPESLPNWCPLADGRKWPGFVALKGMGRVVAIARHKSASTGEWIYVVTKEPLTEYTVEQGHYTQNLYQVPQHLIQWRAAGVQDIHKSPSEIIFYRMGQNAKAFTINEIRSMHTGSPDRDALLLAVYDVVREYPRQLSTLLDSGELEISEGIRRRMEQQGGVATPTSASSSDDDTTNNQAAQTPISQTTTIQSEMAAPPKKKLTAPAPITMSVKQGRVLSYA
jgi:hypothetical protein